MTSDEIKVFPVMTSSGQITFEVEKKGRRLFLHSKYDPLQEARNFVCSKGIKEGDTVIIYGFGLGYHVREAIKTVGIQGRVYVIEPNTELFEEVIKHVSLAPFLAAGRFQLILDNDIRIISEKLAGLMPEVEAGRGHLLIHRPSLELTPDYAAPLKQVLLEWQVKQDTFLRFAGQLDKNIRQNLITIKDLPGVTRLFNKFESVPLLLTAAGPSLDDSLKYIQIIQNKCLIIAVGTALRPLLEQGINPDLAIITDPQPVVSRQIEGINTGVPLIVLPTVHPGVMAAYPGIKIIAYQKGFAKSEAAAMAAGEELIETGGSVVTTALDISIRMGCSPILFAGLDLSYTRGKTHAAGTMYGDTAIIENTYLTEVPNNRMTTVKAPPNLIIYRKWIEQRIEKTKGGIRFYNLSPDGAAIQGAPYIEWDKVVELLHTEQRVHKELLYKICLA